MNPVDELSHRDPKLRDLQRRQGDPPTWKRPATFGTLVRIVLEQQVSLASGKATYDRLRIACEGTINAKRIANLSDSKIRACGLSRQKARYVSTLANSVRSGDFSVSRLAKMDDDAARKSIVSQLGLGDWSADVYLMMALNRPDIFPIGDLALVKGIEELDGKSYDSPDSIIQRAEVWRPYRSTATKMIWSLYLDNRRRT